MLTRRHRNDKVCSKGRVERRRIALLVLLVIASLVCVSADDVEDGVALRLETRSSGVGALRPQVLLDAAFALMGRPALDAPRVRRVRQAHEESGRIVEPFGPFGNEGCAPLS